MIVNSGTEKGLKKIVINRGTGALGKTSNSVDFHFKEFAAITGQQPVATKAKLSISGFQIREGMLIGVKVTLRRAKMYSFLKKLIHIVLPQVRDFQGLPVKFDGTGNYTFGLTEQLVFPELTYEELPKPLGFTITIVTTAQDDGGGYSILKELGFPFAR